MKVTLSLLAGAIGALLRIAFAGAYGVPAPAAVVAGSDGGTVVVVVNCTDGATE
jgi:hypothetical protein